MLTFDIGFSTSIYPVVLEVRKLHKLLLDPKKLHLKEHSREPSLTVALKPLRNVKVHYYLFRPTVESCCGRNQFLRDRVPVMRFTTPLKCANLSVLALWDYHPN